MEVQQKKKFIIIDAMSLAYKAYFAFMGRPLATKKGEPTSAVYGFLTQMIRILEVNKPDFIAVAFDSKEKTFRHERYEHYKATRSAMPDDMISQLQRIKDIIDALNIPVYIIPGFEADDIIGTAVKKAEAMGLEAFAITPDKDFNQIVTDNIKVVKPGKTTDEIIVVDKERIREEFGFEPMQMIDYLALVGDSSDNIPGVSGIGPKGAIPLIQKFGTVEGIYENIDAIDKASLKQKLIDGKENAFLSKELATIHTEVPFDCNITASVITKPDFKKLQQIFEELEFRTMLQRFEKLFGVENLTEDIKFEPEEVFDKSKVKYKLITTKKEAEKLAGELSKCGMFVFDTETDSLDFLNARLAGVSFSFKEAEAYFVALNPASDKTELFSPDLGARLSLEDFTSIFKHLFEDKKISKICQNGKFDIAILRTHGIKVNNFYFDTMVASYVLDPDQKHGMDDMARRLLNYSPIPLTEILGDKKVGERIFTAPLDKLSDYSCEDADITLRLYKKLEEELKINNQGELCYNMEFPLIPVLEDMEREGVRIDVQSLQSLSKDLLILMDNYAARIYELSGEEFNINSPAQLQKVLYEKLGLTAGKKTKTGFSTDAKSLDALKGSHEIIDLILEYRTVAKLKSTYADSLPSLIHPKTGRIHTSFNQTVVSTGRLSSNNPNLQNIPIRSELGKEIRKAFVPRDSNHVILSADYSQIELRIMAGICQDEVLCEAFRVSEDIHRSTAALVFQVDPKDVTPDMRRRAKEVNFGILYGIGAFGLKTRLGISQSHAQQVIDAYFNTFKKVSSFMEESVAKAREKGYAETLMGRRRYLKNINSSNRTVRQFEERAAINMPVQGTAADMIKLAMINIHKELEKGKFKSKMVLQVHDELVFDARKDELDELKPMVEEIMENALPLRVPILVETGVGDNWLDAH